MFQPQNTSLNYNQLIYEIEKGTIKIPQFQREFIWSKKDSANLLDSIIKGYPIGTFILWKTKEKLRTIKNIGNVNLPEIPEGEFVNYVLDGQQRMTSLYVGIKGLTINHSLNKEVNYSEIYINLEAKEDEEIVTIDVKEENLNQYLSLLELIEGGLSLAKKYEEKYHKKIEDYINRFKTYSFPVITINEVPIEVATEIFTRINVGGKSLSVFEIMVAKTFDTDKNFDLSEKYDQLIERLSTRNYETIPNSTILQCVSVCLAKECTKNTILKLDKKKFIDVWDNVVDAIERAVEYFKLFYRIPVSQLLPYDGLLVPFTYFFFYHKDRPLDIKKKYLEDYFWRTVLNSRFSNSLETKLSQDIKRIDKILKNELPKYEMGIDLSFETLSANGHFSTGTAYIKGFLCLLSYQEPKSFKDNSIININNNWLKQANSKNYHHFFPKAYLNKKGEDYFFINHIANIVIVDDFLNKRVIRDKSPSQYMKEFIENSELITTMQTHLIPNLNEFGIWDDNFDIFYEKRLEIFSKELEKRLVIIPNQDKIWEYK